MPESRARRLRHATCGAILLGFALLGASCGTADTAVPQNPGPTPPASNAATPSASPGSDAWDASGDSFGVDRNKWPTTVKAAGPMVERLPKSFAGQSGETYFSPKATDEDGGEGASAGAQYGQATALSIAEAYVTTDTVDGEPEKMTAGDLMAVHFLIGYACAKGSYRGTAPPADGKVGPDPAGDQPTGPVWFSCRIDGAEGDEDFSGHAVGWISGQTAWQVLGPDADTVRSLVTALHEAKS